MIYLDYNATTPLSDKVKESIKRNLDTFGNPSSLYSIGEKSKKEINEARKHVAKLINAEPSQIIFTGCATESNNSVISSCVDSHKNERVHIITSSVEHSAIIETLKYYQEHRDVEVTYLDVDEFGRISLNQLKNSIKDNTVLVSIMMVNNEIGNIYPIKEIGEIIRNSNSNILFHTDATQAIGKCPVDVKALDVDYLTLSGHKFYAPKGVGALYIRDKKSFLPFMRGGHQEERLRAGTENLVSIIAMGVAAEETLNFSDYEQMALLRDSLEKRITTHIKASRIIGDKDNRICNTSCILLDGFSGDEICAVLSDLHVAISSGSACNSVDMVPSHVMKALQIDQIPIRISLGRNTTRQEIDAFINSLALVIKKLKNR